MVAAAKPRKRQAKPDLLQIGRRIYKEDRLPREFEWVSDLTQAHQRQFFYEFKRALADALVDDDPAMALQLIDDWKATAEYDPYPEFVEELIRRANAPAEEFLEFDSIRRR